MRQAIITGGDSGIGRAVAIAFAREGANLLISYLDEDEDAIETLQVIAIETLQVIKESGRKAILVPGDIQHASHCWAIVGKAVSELGGNRRQADAVIMGLASAKALRGDNLKASSSAVRPGGLRMQPRLHCGFLRAIDPRRRAHGPVPGQASFMQRLGAEG